MIEAGIPNKKRRRELGAPYPDVAREHELRRNGAAQGPGTLTGFQACLPMPTGRILQVARDGPDGGMRPGCWRRLRDSPAEGEGLHARA